MSKTIDCVSPVLRIGQKGNTQVMRLPKAANSLHEHSPNPDDAERRTTNP